MARLIGLDCVVTIYFRSSSSAWSSANKVAGLGTLQGIATEVSANDEAEIYPVRGLSDTRIPHRAGAGSTTIEISKLVSDDLLAINSGAFRTGERVKIHVKCSESYGSGNEYEFIGLIRTDGLRIQNENQIESLSIICDADGATTSSPGG